MMQTIWMTWQSFMSRRLKIWWLQRKSRITCLKNSKGKRYMISNENLIYSKARGQPNLIFTSWKRKCWIKVEKNLFRNQLIRLKLKLKQLKRISWSKMKICNEDLQLEEHGLMQSKRFSKNEDVRFNLMVRNLMISSFLSLQRITR